MSLVLRNRDSASNDVTRRDPFSMARELFGWDPFFTTRTATAFVPAFEVKETVEGYVIKADVPGVAEGDIDVAVHNSVLSITGSRQSEERKEGEAYALYERQFGSFTRSFQLPELADGEKIEAKLDNGVLTVTIGKKAAAKPRKIAFKK